MINYLHITYAVLFIIPSIFIFYQPFPSFSKQKLPIGALLVMLLLSSLVGMIFSPGGISNTIIGWAKNSNFINSILYSSNVINNKSNNSTPVASLLPFQSVIIISLLMFWGYFLYRVTLNFFIAVIKIIISFIDFIKYFFSKEEAVKNIPEEKQPDWVADVYFLIQAQWPLSIILLCYFSYLPWMFQKAKTIQPILYALVWIGVWVILLEVVSFLRNVSLNVLSQDKLEVGGEDVEASENEGINKLFNTYQKKFASCLLGKRAGGEAKKAKKVVDLAHVKEIFIQQMPEHQATKAQKVFDQYLAEDDVLISETLTYYHLVLYMELIMHCIHHKGSVLIIAPHQILDDFNTDLSDIIDEFYGRFSLRMHDWRQEELLSNDAIDLHFTTVEKLAGLIKNKGVLEETRLILVLHAHAIDRALLRYETGRISQSTNIRTIKVCHVQEFYNDEAAIRSAISTNNLMQIKLIPNNHLPPHTLVWRNSEQTSKILNEAYDLNLKATIDISSLVLLNPDSSNNELVKQSVLLDENYRYDEDQTESLVNNSDIESIKIKHLFEELRPSEKMLVIEDMNNIVFSLQRNIHVFPNDKYLYHIISHNYLLRDFMLECAGSNHELSPKIGVIEGRITDLAWQIIRTLKASPKGVAESVLTELIAKASLSDKLTSDIYGLQQIFSQAFNRPILLNCSVFEGHASVSLQAGNDISPYKSLAIKHAGHEFLFNIPQSDHGLTYGPSILMQLKGKFYRVNEVTDTSIEVTQEPVFNNDLFFRQQYYFYRHYCITYNNTGKALPELVSGKLSLNLTQYNVSYSRISCGYLALPECTDQIKTVNYNNFKSAIKHNNPTSSALLVRVKLLANEYEGDIGKLEQTLAALLQEMFKSLFPVESHNLVVLAVSSAKKELNLTEELDKQIIPSIMYPTVEFTEKGNIGDERGIEILILEDSETDLGVVNYYSSTAEHVKSLLILVERYLKWSDEQSINQLFHSFNGEILPDYFNYPQLKEYLQPLTVNTDDVALLEPITTDFDDSEQQENIINCDFCGTNIDVFEVLKDKRNRCRNCSKNAIDTVEQFKEHLDDVIKKMELRYGISLTRNIGVDMVNASTLHERKGECFIPTDAFEPRAIGFATQREDGQFIIVIENGFSSLDMRTTLAHELTHIWQFIVCQNSNLARPSDEVMEGQASFIEMDFLGNIDMNEAEENKKSADLVN